MENTPSKKRLRYAGIEKTICGVPFTLYPNGERCWVLRYERRTVSISKGMGRTKNEIIMERETIQELIDYTEHLLQAEYELKVFKRTACLVPVTFSFPQKSTGESDGV